MAGSKGMIARVAVCYYFIGQAVLVAIISGWTFVTETDFVMPIYHVGILTIVWQDYVELGILTTFASLFFAWLVLRSD